METYNKLLISAILTMGLLFCAYLGSYAYFRRDRLSLEYVSRGYIFSSEAEAREWATAFKNSIVGLRCEKSSNR